MWHGRRRGRLALEPEHRRSLIRNLAKELINHQRVITTLLRAKEASRFADGLVTLAKQNTLHSRRQLVSKLGSGTETFAKRLTEIIAPKFSDRKGGYTRVIHYRFRKGDGAQLALLEFSVPIETKEKKPKKKKQEKKHVHDHKEAAEMKSSKEKEHVKESKQKASEKSEDVKDKTTETPKKGGFLKNLRKFLTGKDE